MYLDNQKLVELLSPAIIISVAGYLIRFFGKVITDQKPFHDDRDWGIELAGILFFITLLLIPGAIALAIVYGFGSLGVGHWIRFGIIAFILVWLLLGTLFLTEKIYQIKFPLNPLLSELLLKLPNAKRHYRKFKNFLIWINNYIPLDIISGVLIYISILEYQSGSFLWIAFMGGEIFICFIFIALNHSMRANHQLAKVDIYTIGSTEPIRSVILLKVNDDNVRFRDGDKVVILNKKQMLKIEQAIPQK